jgi:alpha-N-acetylglucosaminidase
MLANYATPLQQKWVLAYLQHDTASYDKYSAQFIELMDDMDALLNTRKEFLLGKWIADARDCGADENEKNLYELNARNIITLWGNKESELHEYSNRQWAGLINDFYKPRWEQFFVYLKQKMKTGARMETGDFEIAIKNWEWKWVNSSDTKYASVPKGDPVDMSKKLFDKYRMQIDKIYEWR